MRSASRARRAKAAEEIAGTLKSWTTVHDAFTRYGHCDDGAIGEGFSDSVVKLLAGRWSDLGELQRLVDADARFRRFVHQHIDGTTDPNDLKRIVENAARRCPDNAKALCAELSKAAQEALR